MSKLKSRSVSLPQFEQSTGQFDQAIQGSLRASSLATMQMNIGLSCNLACRHCHVESSPHRTEQMDRKTMKLALRAAESADISLIDITGGAPEMNPHFRFLIEQCHTMGFQIMVRTNLTILLEEGYRDLPTMFNRFGVHLIASLPCYMEENVNSQRGMHVYERSIQAIMMLNQEGYGVEPDQPLDLVYNPGGASLPPRQQILEDDYRCVLRERFGISFSRLIAIANMPIGRFREDLRRRGEEQAYMDVLRNAFNPNTIDGLMCRHQIHVSWDGFLHDCDFNYALGLKTARNVSQHISTFDAGALQSRRIVTSDHCFGCTAGNGSSCGGALT